MEITCDNCGTKLNIPDKKIPQDRQVVVSCPKCKKKLLIDTRSKKQDIPQPEAEEKPEPETNSFEDGYSYGDEDVSLDFYGESKKLALVMENDPRKSELLKKAVEELNYKYIPGQNIREAIGKIRFHDFDLVILADQFDGIELKQSPILHYLNHLSMSTRRRMFVSLIGDNLKTMDYMMAFSMSVDLVINLKDLEKAAGILKNAILDSQKFYKVFMDTLLEVGKA